MAHHQGMSLLALDNTLTANIMQRRFHADLRIRAVESLLFERIPLSPPALNPGRSSPALLKPVPGEAPGVTLDEETSTPRVFLQSNGSYSLMVSTSGGGYSRYNGVDLTRWGTHPAEDRGGTCIYLRDLRSGGVWSANRNPVGGGDGSLSVRFGMDRAQFERDAFGIETLMEVTVAPEDDVELRRVTITNRTLQTRYIELTSFAELALARHPAGPSQPAPETMSVETECLDGRVLLARRRTQSPGEPQVWAAHLIVGETGLIQFETDRREFLGRGNSAAWPDALKRDLTGSTGVILDPVFSLRCRPALEARARQVFTFVTLVASTREALLSLVDKYRRVESVARTFEMTWTRGQLEFQYLGISPAAARQFEELASHLLYPKSRLHLSAGGPAINEALPILTVLAADHLALPLIRELLLAHTYWRLRGLRSIW